MSTVLSDLGAEDRLITYCGSPSRGTNAQTTQGQGRSSPFTDISRHAGLLLSFCYTSS